MGMAFIKICGITQIDDAKAAIDCGATAIGLNLWPESPRKVDLQQLRKIMDAVRGKIKCVLVTVDLEPPVLHELVRQFNPDWLQLHGSESDDVVQDLQPLAYKAVGLSMQRDVDRALAVPGKLVMVDAFDGEQHGGTGVAPPPNMAAAVCRARKTILAGGLGPDNVAAAIASMHPYGVDAASRLEKSPGLKDHKLVKQFVEQARGAFERLGK
jgi:phosphoribosylanthranilate isomerase